MNSDPIQRRKLYQAVEQRLLERIRRGEIPPGQQLPPERELMEVFGVGRPAVREALQSLQRSGIIEITHGERARVVLPTAASLIEQIAGGAHHLLRMQPGTLEHLLDARVFLEAGMARLAAERASDDDIERLHQRLREHQQALDKLDEFVARDMALHREIARVSGNPIFPAIVEALFQWAGDHHQPIVRAPGAEHVTLAEHARIVDAIAARDPAAAEQAMREHVTRASDLYRAGTSGM